MRRRADSPDEPATIGIDTGGTFTDLVLARGSELRFEKVASTPAAPERALLDGLARLAAPDSAAIVHGTTVALNALLTRRVARAALVTNRGLADLIEIARQDRPELYELAPVKPEPLVPRELRFEVRQRSWPSLASGGRALEEVERPSDAELADLARAIERARPDSIAVCLLHSYADPAIEERVARALAHLRIPITTSSALVREHREFERFSTAVVNACLVPVVRDYLVRLAAAAGGGRLSLLQSSGGSLPAERAAVEPVRVLFSGPAGGVVGARAAAREAGLARLVGLDMGGTSTDVAFEVVGGERRERRPGPVEVGGIAIAVPALDIHTIGCGGGSLIRVDAGGVLHVGPESAGADPGPVAYGMGDVPTLTDAHVLLGHVAGGAFLAGRLALDDAAVARAFERVARELGVAPREAAMGALEVARAAMRRALAAMTMQRGEDPRSTPLVAFGGAGGLHAAELAASLGMPGALVPRAPGCLSALGMARAEAVREATLSVLAPLASVPRGEWRRQLRELAQAVRRDLVESGCDPRSIECELALDLRYAGQSFELRVAADRAARDPAGAFHARHEELYGHRLEASEIELVHLCARAIARRPRARPREARARPIAREAIAGYRAAAFGDGSTRARFARVPVIDRSRLAPGDVFAGPAIVEEFSGTMLVPPRWRARVTAGEHLWLERA
jgi:N-methylhydantoinase A